LNQRIKQPAIKVLLNIFSSVAPYGDLFFIINRSKSSINNIDYKTDQQPGNEHTFRLNLIIATKYSKEDSSFTRII
jgi:hypothetical protein